MKKKFIVTAIIIFTAAAVFAASPLFPCAKSLAVMKIYSLANEKDSLMREKGIEIEIPGGGKTKEKDWYPFVMTYNADSEFRSFTGKQDARLTIMYNFPAFDISKGCSRLYDDGSPYYGGFYGAYAAEGKLGFNDDGSFNAEEASVVPEFDLRKLVLEDMGMKRSDGIFEWHAARVEENIEYAGHDGWTFTDADMTVNGTLHVPKENYRNYIQYGRPAYDLKGKDEFAPVAMKGRLYARYFEEKDVSIYFYIMAKDMETLEECDEKILSESCVRLTDELNK